MKIVMTYTEGDGCTYSCDHVYPFEYRSAEDALVDFEVLFNLADGDSFTFKGMEFHCSTFEDQWSSPRITTLPEFYTLKEWFEAKSLG